MTERADVIVIGGGHNGLVCAARLAKAGLGVVCLEARDRFGGMTAARTFADGFRTPGLATYGPPVAPAVRAELELDRYGYAPGEPCDTIAFARGDEPLVIGADSVTGGDVSDADRRAYPGFRQRYLAFAKALRPLFENRPPRLRHMPLGDRAILGRLGVGLRFGLGRDEMYEFLRVVASNVYDELNDVFDSETLKGALAANAIMGSAMGPRTPGTVLLWLKRLHAELGGPPGVMPGGDKGLAAALAAAAADKGVDLRPDSAVRRIRVVHDEVAGVELANGERIAAQRVVSAIDPRTTFLSLVGAGNLDAMFAKRVTEIRGAGVVAKLDLALSDLPEFRGIEPAQLAHRLLFAPSMDAVERAFNPSKYGRCSERFVLDVVVPSLHDASLAPRGQHVMSINVAYVPCSAGVDDTAAKDAIADAVIAQLAERAPGLESLVLARDLTTPRDVESRYGAVEGHWHHGELSIHQSLMMRPLYGAAQYDTPVRGLYLCSAGCHPGGDATGLPGRNAAKRILDKRPGT